MSLIRKSSLMLVAALLVTPAMAQMPGRPLMASLTGSVEVPGPGKLDASGRAEVRVVPGRGRVCTTVRYSGIPMATMAHIHRGAAGVAGPPVVTLAMPSGGVSRGCQTVTRDLARELIANPDQFYVNVHSQAFASGAIRGQLHR